MSESVSELVSDSESDLEKKKVMQPLLFRLSAKALLAFDARDERTGLKAAKASRPRQRKRKAAKAPRAAKKGMVPASAARRADRGGALPFRVRTKVEAKFGYTWFPGTVVAIEDGRRYRIDWDRESSFSSIPMRHVRLRSESHAQSRAGRKTTALTPRKRATPEITAGKAPTAKEPASTKAAAPKAAAAPSLRQCAPIAAGRDPAAKAPAAVPAVSASSLPVKPEPVARSRSSCGVVTRQQAAAAAADIGAHYKMLGPESRGETLIGFNLFVDGRAVTVTEYRASPTNKKQEHVYTVVDDKLKKATRRLGEAWLATCGFIRMPIDKMCRVQLRDYGCIAEALAVQDMVREKVKRGAYVAWMTSAGKKKALLKSTCVTTDVNFGAHVTAQRATASTDVALNRAEQSCAPPTLGACGLTCPFRRGSAGFASIARHGRCADAAIVRKRRAALSRRGDHGLCADSVIPTVRARPPPTEGCPAKICKLLFKPARPLGVDNEMKLWARCWCAKCNDTALYPRGCVYVMTHSLLVYEAKMSAPEGQSAYVARHSVQAAVRAAMRPKPGASPAVAAALARVNAAWPTAPQDAPQRMPPHRLLRLTHETKQRSSTSSSSSATPLGTSMSALIRAAQALHHFSPALRSASTLQSAVDALAEIGAACHPPHPGAHPDAREFCVASVRRKSAADHCGRADAEATVLSQAPRAPSPADYTWKSALYQGVHSRTSRSTGARVWQVRLPRPFQLPAASCSYPQQHQSPDPPVTPAPPLPLRRTHMPPPLFGVHPPHTPLPVVESHTWEREPRPGKLGFGD